MPFFAARRASRPSEGTGPGTPPRLAASIEVAPGQVMKRMDLLELIPPATRVALVDLGNLEVTEWAGLTKQMARRGLEPVPHIAARRLTSRGALEERLAAMSGEAGVRDVVTGSTGNLYTAVQYGTFGDPGLAKFNKDNGALIWDQHFTDPGYCMTTMGHRSVAHSVGTTYTALSAFTTPGFNLEILLLQYNTGGTMTGMTNYSWDIAPGPLAADAAGNVYMAAYTPNSAAPPDNDLVLVKFNSAGTVQWTRTITFAQDNAAADLALDGAGYGYIVEDYPHSGADPNGYGILKFSCTTGTVVWTVTLPGAAEPNGIVRGVAVDGSNLYVAGTDLDTLWGTPTRAVARIIKMDLDGNVVWSRNLPGNPDSTFHDIKVDAAGNVFATGNTGTMTDPDISDFLAASYDSNGNLRWEATYDSGTPRDYADSLALGSTYVVGTSDEDLRLLKYLDFSGVAVSTTLLTSSLSVDPTPAEKGGTFTATMTIVNTGGVSFTGIAPVLTVSDPALAQVSGGPTPAIPGGGFLLNPGESLSVSWQLTALETGTLSLTASTTAIDGGSGSLVSTQAVASQRIRVPFTEDSVVYPNPVDGDAFSLYLKLSGDASEVTVDVFNAGFRRVFTGTWNDVSRTGSEVVIEGVLDWAPGVYIVKPRVSLASGESQEIPAVKVWLKR